MKINKTKPMHERFIMRKRALKLLWNRGNHWKWSLNHSRYKWENHKYDEQ